MDKKQYIFKNGGFPPINYCPAIETNKGQNTKTSKERFFANAPRQNINIRQLLTESVNKKPLIIIDNVIEDVIEVVASL
jgi:hypothetical protein